MRGEGERIGLDDATSIIYTSAINPNGQVPVMTAASPTMQTLAPVLIVDAVEPCIDFWAANLGFAKANEVPGPDGKLIFASVKKDGVEIMYQTRASVVADSPSQAAELTGHSVALFLTVPAMADLDAI